MVTMMLLAVGLGARGAMARRVVVPTAVLAGVEELT
jgi:hypothetical protein